MSNIIDQLAGGQLTRIENLLNQLLQKETEMAVDLTNLTAAVAAETTVTASAITLLQQLAAQIAALAKQPTVDPAALQAFADTLNANATSLAAAITANTPTP